MIHISENAVLYVLGVSTLITWVAVGYVMVRELLAEIREKLS